jgi:excinuclease UvrABC nuclease subunit
MKKNILEELPGFWPKTRKKILNKYWSLDKIKEISKDELSKILNVTQIETLENHWLID